MKIGIIVDNDLNNDKRVLREADILHEAGHEIFVLCFGFRGKEMPGIEGLKISRIRISKKMKDILFFFLNLIPLYETMWARAIGVFIKSCSPDVLHVHDLYMSRAAYRGIMRSGKKIKMVLDLHENYPYAVLTYNWTKGFLRTILSRPGRWKSKEGKYLAYADWIILLSDEFREVLTGRYPFLNKKRFIIFPNVPDLRQMDAVVETIPDIGIKKGQIVVLYFGIVAERRGVFDVLDVFHSFTRDDHPLVFLVIGPIDRKDRELFMKAIHTEPLESKVKYIPWIDLTELPNYLSITDICIAPFHRNPQHESGVANKIYDYMLGGKPIIASDCEPQKRLIEDVGCGIIYSDREQMKNALTRLASDPGLREEMGAKGKNAIVSNLNITVQGRILVNAYSELIVDNEIKS